ncbi:g9742 [Coccomyxa elongata]
MYAVKVEVKSEGRGESNTASSSASSLPASVLAAGQSSNGDIEEIQVSVGNPRVEHLTGTVHLYRQTHGRDEAGPFSAKLPDGRGDRLCVLALPADMGVAEFCSFVGAYLPQIKEMRLVRREEGRTACMVLLRFMSKTNTDEFYLHFNNKPFSSLEPDLLCRLLYVRDLELVSGTDSRTTAIPPIGQTELPTCPVCLERLDEHISGIVTTVCNHRFHNECLQRWGDTSCPVCRYCSGASTADSHCQTCGTSRDLWMCLICGHVGCGRYREGHAAKHSEETNHCYALELEAQRVWDYASDNYVHRLVQSKKNGKLVELPSPGPSTSRRDANLEHQLDSQTEEALVASKVDYLSEEYNQLLVSQLNQQRVYFEDRLQQQAEEIEMLKGQAQDLSRQRESACEQARSSDRARHAVEQKMQAQMEKAKLLEKDVIFYKEVNAQLELNQAGLEAARKQIQESSEAESMKKDALIQDLQEQVRDLMIYIEAGKSIAEAGGELKDASLLPIPAQQQTARAHKQKSSRRR